MPSTAWTAEFVLDAVRRALASLPLTEVQARPAIRMSVDGLTPADFHAAVERLMSAGCVDVAGMDFPPSRPGLSIDTGQMYLSDPDDPRLSLIIAGTGDKRLVKGSSESFVLTAVDLAIDLVRSLKTPLKKDRTAVALHVVPSDVDAVLKALEGTTGRPPGHGFALGACFAADRTEQSRGYPNAPHIEVE